MPCNFRAMIGGKVVAMKQILILADGSIEADEDHQPPDPLDEDIRTLGETLPSFASLTRTVEGAMDSCFFLFFSLSFIE